MASHNYRLLVALVGLQLAVSPTSLDARDVRADGLLSLHRAGDVSATTYVNGILSGFDYANARLRAGGHPLYCQRPDQALAANEIFDTMGKTFLQTPQMGKFSATLIILHILIEAFPCTSLPVVDRQGQPRKDEPQTISQEPERGDASELPYGEER